MTNKERDTSRSRGVNLGQLAEVIKTTFKDFGVPIEIEDAVEGLRGYHVFLKPLKPTRMRAFTAFEDDLRYALGIDRIEIQAPVPGTKLVGITVPKAMEPPNIKWAKGVKDRGFTKSAPMVVPLGVDEFGKAHSLDIAKAPHILIAGATGSGKSVLLHSIIASLIKKNSPEQVRLLLIDPKRVEFSQLEGVPHLLTPAITDSKKAVIALRWLAREMGRRVDILEDKRVRDINGYHKARSKGDEPLPFIAVIFDEIADIVSAYPREVETSVIRLAQMSRAVGIHIIISTSRPSVNVVTGMMKANIPTRIAAQVHSQIDSRVILDMTGAEKLDGLGDMLFLGGEMTRPIRMQTYSIYETEIEKIKKEVMKKYPPSSEENFEDKSSIFLTDSDDNDEMYEEAKRAVIKAGKASTSFFQRKLGIGYSRSAKLLDLLEERGVIAPGVGSMPREVLIKE